MRSLLDNIRAWAFPISLPVILCAVLAWIYLAPLGERTVQWEAGESSLLIGRPLPDARTAPCEDTKEVCVVILDEPLYMSITPPAGLWHEMHVEALYELRDQEKFEIGLMQDFATQAFALHALENGKTTFLLDGVQKERGAYKLILSAPGVEGVEEKPVLNGVKITFKRNTSVMGEIKWLIKGLWVRRP